MKYCIYSRPILLLSNFTSLFCFLSSTSLSLSLTLSPSLYLVFPARAPSSSSDLTDAQLGLGIEAGDGRSAGVQAGFQLACLATTLGIAIAGGIATGILNTVVSCMLNSSGFEVGELLQISR